MKYILQAWHKKLFLFLSLGILLLLTACGGSLAPVNKLTVQPSVQVNPSFQTQVSPVPTKLPYECGSWASNNAPSVYSTILIYARLMHNNQPVSGATASGTVHFSTFDTPLDQNPVSDSGGYVSFTLPLQGREPRLVPATVDVSFTVNGKAIGCSQAFFTPE